MIEVSGDIIYHDGTAVGFVVVREGTRRERFLEELTDNVPPITDTIASFDRLKRQLDALRRSLETQMDFLS